MPENIKPPIDYEEGSPEVDNIVDDGLDDIERQREVFVAQSVAAPPDTLMPKTPEAKKEPERHIVHSFAELMMRAKTGSGSNRIRIWDMGTTVGTNEGTHRKFLNPIDQQGSFLDGLIHKIRFPYRISFAVFGPDPNDPTGQETEGFFGDEFNEDGFNAKWAGRLDIGKDTSGHNEEWYKIAYHQEVARAKAEENRRNRRR